MSQQHQEGLAHLLYGIHQSGGFVVLTGEVGTGKTLLSQCLLKEVPPDVFLALILNPKLSANELLASICDELHISYDKDNLTLKGLTDSLNTYLLSAHAEGKKTIVLIDEAQNLSSDVLEQIRLLTNLETAETKLLQIILLGQPELKELLEEPELRQLSQRITARYHLRTLSYLESEKYIKHRLEVCGGREDIFNRGAIKKVYELSKGVPRLINVICDRALLGAYVENTRIVTATIINKAAEEVFNQQNSSIKGRLLKVIAGVIIMSAFAFSLYYLMSEQLNRQQIKQPAFLEKMVEGKTKQVTPVALVEEEKPPLDFDFYLKLQQLPLKSALSQLALLWDKSVSEEEGCKGMKEERLHCLFDQSSWEELVELGRPVIMEFSISEAEKEYALLLGLKNGDPVFHFNKEIAFPVDKILKLWKGYYVTLWRSPIHDIKTVFPGRSSRAVKWIKEKISLNSPNVLATPYSDFFDEELKTEVIKFQKQHHLTPDGLVGTKTFIHLQNSDPQDGSPKLGRVK